MLGLDLSIAIGAAYSAPAGSTSAIAASSPAAWHRLDNADYLATSTAGTGAVTNGAAVAYAEDLSGNSRHLTQDTLAYRPAFNSGGWAAFGSGDYLRLPADLSVVEGFVVFKGASLQSGVCALFSETATARYFIHLSSDEIVSLDGASTATRGGAAVGAAAYTPPALTGDNVTLTGANLLENASFQTLSFALSSSNFIRNLGWLLVSAVEFTGPKDIAEVVLYSSRLTTDQRAGVVAELAARHGT